MTDSSRQREPVHFRKEGIMAVTTKPEPKRHDFAAGETGRGPSIPSNGLANDPKAGQWDGRRMSKRMIADYKTFIVTDGEGEIGRASCRERV